MNVVGVNPAVILLTNLCLKGGRFMDSQQPESFKMNTVVSSEQAPFIRMHHSKILALFRALDSLLIVSLLWIIQQSLHLEWTDSHTLLAISAVVLFGYFAEGNEIY